MKEYKRLRKNLSILKSHNIFKIPVKTLTGNEKTEFVLIQEIVVDCLKLLNKIENGTIIELPCKVGDTVYVIRKKAIQGHWEENRYIVDAWGKLAVYEKEFNLVLFEVSKIGEDYFLTKAEAEAKLKELQEKENDNN
jgi:hypothetical protein